ncbi:uncharacterized protein EV420DRAFT_1308249 [Desarmillaria tabescens]|uniref:Heterokaryon incompatibility domain-containing protein n=1 Tax=Armillaria tabescens TaxID=1929756 RepID=A0AA39N5C4_ARMTA|nr:uncharacterized protein EV420DRAFT_1308249 [Desarmillaria tabescens]KAK0458746.1 hypothetical protein EV420DRAFT_1308249 [Desarmillaria tabescens]
MAYGRLRQIWYTRNWSTTRDTLRKWEEADREMRRKALVGNRIINPMLQPRRVWDLYSNRVVPWWCTGLGSSSCGDWKWKWPGMLRPISHAWVDEKDRVDVQTPINRYEWPVPIPKDTSLNLVRIEMLNLQVEYGWLDVLCLRQEGGLGEDMRRDEWKLDVPTIGAVYHRSSVVIYLSGLGRPLSLKEGDLDSDKCWFRRAWTLQEVGSSRVIAGDTPDGPLQAECNHGKYETPLLTRFHEQLQSMSGMSYTGVFVALKSMQNRVSTNPVDKVAGLAFRLQSNTIPAYYESESLEDAWTALVNSRHAGVRGMLFCLYSEPGNAGRKWRPSWDQVMTKSLPAYPYSNIDVDWNKMDEDSCGAGCIEKGLVRGLAVVEGRDRRGELIVKGKDGMEHAFNITATHEYPIPEGTYTLICANKWMFQCWVVGRRLPRERFEKVSVLEITNRYEASQLEDLNVTKKCRNILV